MEQFTQYWPVVAVIAYMAWQNRSALAGVLGSVMSSNTQVDATESDKTLQRVKAWQELTQLCKGDCPEAIAHLDALFPCLRPGHTHGGAK